MEKINVIILSDGGDSEHVRTYFEDITRFELLEPTEQLTENERFIESLKLSSKTYPDRSCILIKNTSYSNLPSNSIGNAVTRGNSIPGVDLFYLCRWQDKCQLYRKVNGVNSLYWTQNPQGFQAILFTPSGISKVLDFEMDPVNGPGKTLTDKIKKGHLRAICSMPNIFNYNAMDYATDNREFSRFNECQSALAQNGTNEVSPHTYFYLTGLVIIVFAIGIGLYKIGPDGTTKKSPSQPSTPVKTIKQETSYWDPGV